MRALRTLPLALLLLLLATSAYAQPAAAPDPATLRAIEAQVVRIRGLQPLAEPDLRLLDHTSLTAYLSDEFEHNYLPSERETDQKELLALGLLQPGTDLAQIDLDLLGEQVVGVYDPDVKALFVVSDQGAFGPAARMTYAHEFNHALQDQYYDLNRLAPHHSDNNDRSLAMHALLEGDAVMLQTMWAEQNLTHSELLELASGGDSDAGLDAAPLIVRSELLFPYLDGLNFVRQAYRQAGNRYAAVDGIFANPPESTAQVLHPEKYRAHIHPVSITLPDIAASLGPDWRRVGRGVLGELDTRVVLQQWGTPSLEANRVAAGWAGDAWQLVERGGRSALAVHWTWSDSTAASDFFATYTRSLRTRFPDSIAEDDSQTREALTSGDTATDVRLMGSDVVAVIAPDRDTANAVASAVTSSVP